MFDKRNSRRSGRSGVFLSLYLCLLCASLSCARAAAPVGVTWKGYGEALSEARQKGVPVFLFFYSYPCASCSEMESTTLRDERVVLYLRDQFVSVRIDKPQSPLLAETYDVHGLPLNFFLSPEGEKIAFLPGYVEPDIFLGILKYVREGHYRSKTLPEYLKGS